MSNYFRFIILNLLLIYLLILHNIFLLLLCLKLIERNQLSDKLCCLHICKLRLVSHNFLNKILLYCHMNLEEYMLKHKSLLQRQCSNYLHHHKLQEYQHKSMDIRKVCQHILEHKLENVLHFLEEFLRQMCLSGYQGNCLKK